MRSYNTITSFAVSNTAQLKDALNGIAELRRSGVNQPVSIQLKAGEYELDSTLEIKPNINAVTIEPYGSDKVTISGGRKISGFARTTFNGVDCFGTLIEDVKNGKWEFTDLYVDGLRADFTRYPASGGLHKIDIDNKEGQLFSSSKWMTVKTEEIPSEMKLDDGAIVSYCHYWIDEHSPIESYDRESGKLVFSYASRFNISGDIEYYIENTAYAFKNPNEWYLDRKSGMLYYIPRSAEQTPESIEVYAPVVSKLIKIAGTKENKVCNISFRNIKFAYTRGDYESKIGVHFEEDPVVYASDAQAVSNADGSISLEYAHACEFTGCELVNFGVHGIVVGFGCDNITISGNCIYDGGAGGVKINGCVYGGDSADNTYGNTVSDNIIKHCGRRYLSACGVLVMNSYENTVSHNEICDLYYTGVSCGWVWGYTPSITRDNIIEKNHIYNLGQGLLSDMGGVYLLGAQPGTKVRGNLIHDIKSREYGGWALYTDEGSGYVTLENNVCYSTSDNGYHQHYGRMNSVRNNIFAFAGKELLRVSRFEQHLSIIFENNILYSKGVPVYGLNERHVTSCTVGSGKNVIFDCTTDTPNIVNGKTLAEVQAYGMEDESIIADPMFADPANFDFTLSPDSPAYKLGFKPIDISDVGPRYGRK